MKKYRIIFLDGIWVDFVPPHDFHFPTFITTVRSAGFFLSEEVYIRFDLVRAVIPWKDENSPPDIMPSNAPTTVKMQ